MRSLLALVLAASTSCAGTCSALDNGALGSSSALGAGSLGTTAVSATCTPPTISYANGDAVVGAAFTLNATTTGATSFALTSGTLPGGLSLNTSTGAITGTPTTVETQTGLVVTATAAAGCTTASAAFQIDVTCGEPDTTNLRGWLDGRDLASAGAISNIENSGSLGGTFEQSTSSAKPTAVLDCVNGYPCASFDGTDFLTSDLAASSWTFAHDGVDESHVYVLYIVDGSEPDTAQTFATTNNAASANVGFWYWYDDRSASSQDDANRWWVTNGGGVTAVLASTGANDAVSGTWHTGQASYDNGRTGDDAVVYVDGVQQGSAETTNAPSGSAPGATLHIGATATPSQALTGDIAQLLIYEGAHTAPTEWLDCIGGL